MDRPGRGILACIPGAARPASGGGLSEGPLSRECRLLIDGVPLCRVRVARTPWLRLRGWVGYRPDPDESLWLEPCMAVHTFGMVVPIDVAFVDGRGRVLRVVSGMRPFRLAACPGAAAAVEFPAGYASRITEGSVLEVARDDNAV